MRRLTDSNGVTNRAAESADGDGEGRGDSDEERRGGKLYESDQ